MKAFSHWPLCPEDMIARFQSWKGVLDRREPGFVFFYPFTEHTYQSRYFLEWLTSIGYSTPRIVNILPMTEDISEFQLLDNKDRRGIIIDGAEHLFSPGKERLVSDLITQARVSETPLLFLTEMFSTEFKNIVEKYHDTAYSTNTFSYPLHDKKNVVAFVHFLEGMWKFKLPPSLIDPIYEETGGYLWLIKEILRQIRNEGRVLSEIVASTPYRWRTEMIWKRLPQEYQNNLVNIHRGLPDSAGLIYEYFENTRLVNSTQKQILPLYIERLIDSQLKTKLKINRHTIHINEVDRSSCFSVFELNILSCLISKKGEIVNRDELAKAKWGEKWCELYSDWAIDQTVYRIRNKLNTIDKTIKITSFRKKGYAISW